MCLLVRLFSIVIFLSFAQLAIANNEKESLDLMWDEQGGSNVVDEQTKSRAERSADKGSLGKQMLSTLDNRAGAVTMSTPLCSLKSFEQSEFIINGGGWPHIGPFKRLADKPNQLEDAQKNRITLSLTDDKITGAELHLVRQPGESLLHIQIATDFFLEALGAKPKKVSQLNDQLERQKKIVTEKYLTNPVNLSVGKYIISMQDDANSSSPDQPPNLVIRVNYNEANEDATKEHSRESDIVAQQASSFDNGISKSDRSPIAVLQKTDIETNLPSKLPPPTPETKTEVKPKPEIKPEIKLETKPESKSPTKPETSSNVVEKKQEFEEIIRNWQRIKKVAVKERQVDGLKQVLSGKALDRQADAIKWLVANHKYYEMAPKGVTVDHYKELTAGQKFAVFAKVQEESKLIDEATKQVLKDTKDTYNVNYTVEKIGDRWLITDSAIVTAGNSSPKPSSNKPSR